jgi:hypothetical protein
MEVSQGGGGWCRPTRAAGSAGTGHNGPPGSSVEAGQGACDRARTTRWWCVGRGQQGGSGVGAVGGSSAAC